MTTRLFESSSKHSHEMLERALEAHNFEARYSKNRTDAALETRSDRLIGMPMEFRAFIRTPSARVETLLQIAPRQIAGKYALFAADFDRVPNIESGFMNASFLIWLKNSSKTDKTKPSSEFSFQSSVLIS